MDNKSFYIRKAYREDIPEVLRITREVFKMYKMAAGIPCEIGALKDTYESLEEDINNKLFLVAVSVLDNKVVGSVRVEVSSDGTAYLSRFGVDSNQQKSGVGAGLISAVDSSMQDLGVNKIFLHTASKVESLIKFYYGKGFYIDSTTKDKGYIRALLCKEYEVAKENSMAQVYAEKAV